jgi:hypothetical protein
VRVVDSARCTSQLHFDKEHSTLLCLMSQLYYNNMEAVCPFETFATIYQSPRHYFPERHEVICRNFLRPRSQLTTGLLKSHYFPYRSDITYCLINRNSFAGRKKDLKLLRNIQIGASLLPASYSMRPGRSLSGSKTVGARN